VKIICFVPHPGTTQGEARRVAKLAREHGWREIIVVSGTPQTTRARIRFARCFRGTLLFDPADPSSLSGHGGWIYNVICEWGALIKAETLQRGC
jgi:hypothetical protein